MGTHKIDHFGSFSVGSLLNGVLRGMPCRDGLAHAIAKSLALYHTLTQCVSPLVSPTATQVVLSSFTNGGSTKVTLTLCNAASVNAPIAGVRGTRVRGNITNQKKLSGMLGAIKDQLAFLTGLTPTGINGAQGNLLQVTGLCVEAAELREQIVRSALHSSVNSLRACMVISGLLAYKDSSK